MEKYHKIQTVFKRDPDNNFKTLLMGEYSVPEFGYLKDCLWDFTEKVDGTNIRVILKDGKVAVKGKTDQANVPAPLLTNLTETLPAAKLSEIFDEDICLYGEGYGAKIQKGGGNYLPHQDFVLFDVKIGGIWLQRIDVLRIARRLNISAVPQVGIGTLEDFVAYVQNGFTSTWGDFPAEGLVARPHVGLQTRRGDRVITKIKHKDFKRTA